jgi:tRNA(adenine34) deaminase
MKDDTFFMSLAIKEAKNAKQYENMAIGAVVVLDGAMIGRGFNQTNFLVDASCHAEVVAIRDASKTIGNQYLNGCILYSTHEPCCMCTGLVGWSKIKKIIYGVSVKYMNDTWKEQYMKCEDVINQYPDWDIEVIGGVMKTECASLDLINELWRKKYYD